MFKKLSLFVLFSFQLSAHAVALNPRLFGSFALTSKEFGNAYDSSDQIRLCPKKIAVTLAEDNTVELRGVELEGIFFTDNHEQSFVGGHAICLRSVVGSIATPEQLLNYERCRLFNMKTSFIGRFVRLEKSASTEKQDVLVRGLRYVEDYKVEPETAVRQKASAEMDYTCTYRRL